MTNEPKTPEAQPAGEYPPLPQRYYMMGKKSVWTEDQMRAYADATHAMRVQPAVAPAAPAAVAGPSDEMVLAAVRIRSPNLFRHGLHPLPKDGPETAMNMRAEANQVRHMLAAAFAAAPATQAAPAASASVEITEAQMLQGLTTAFMHPRAAAPEVVFKAGVDFGVSVALLQTAPQARQGGEA